jgi:gamma-glutamyl-gamma-aminobutyrate hydrolase PuuD
MKGDDVKREAKHPVQVWCDHKLEFPDMYLSVYIEGDDYEQRAFSDMLVRSRCRKVNSPEHADFVIFTGGEDVDPKLYGARNSHPKTKINTARDDKDLYLYLYCVERGIPMLGICRGAQFLHVCNGGKLYQHVDGHYGDHMMFDRDTKELVQRISSVHHQMVKPNLEGGMQIIATSGGSTERWLDGQNKETGAGPDIEAFFYRETLCLGIQGHPEYRGYNYFAYWAMCKVKSYFMENPDVVWLDSYRRLDPELIKQRNAGLGMKNSGLIVETKDNVVDLNVKGKK